MSQEKTLNDFAADNVVTGMLLLCKEALVTAIQDKRLHRGHLRVIAAIASYMNLQTAKAWPSRDAIADCLEMPVKTVTNLLLELRAYKYLVAEKQAVAEADDKRLTVYTFGAAIDRDTIQRTITDIIMQMRAAGREPAAYATDAQESPALAGEEAEKVPPQRDNCVDNNPVAAGKSRPSGTVADAKIPSQRENPVPAGELPLESPAPAGKTAKSPVPAGAVYNNNNIPASEPPKVKRQAKPKTRLPANWEPSEYTIQWALDNYQTNRRRVLVEAEKFRDYHVGNGSLKADWVATWRTWWGNGYHKIPRKLDAKPDMLAGAKSVDTEADALKAAIQRARKAEEEIS